jgi:hypothetical protein
MNGLGSGSNYTYIAAKSISMYTYKLSLDDILNPLLYDISTNEKKIAKRKRFFWYIIAMTALIAIGGFVFKDLFIGATFLGITALYLFFGNWYTRIAYKRALRRSIRKNYSSLQGSPIHLKINDDHLYIDTESGDASYPFSSFLMITETYAYFMIRLDNDQVLGIPKFSTDLEHEIKKMISDHAVPYRGYPDWKY